MWLKNLRKNVGLTQEELAIRLQNMGYDYSRSSVNNWERATNHPPLDDPKFVHVLAKALKISTPMLLSRAGFELDVKHSDLAERMAVLMDSLPDEKKELALKLVEALSEN